MDAEEAGIVIVPLEALGAPSKVSEAMMFNLWTFCVMDHLYSPV